MSEKTLAEQQIDALVADARAAYPTCTECGEDIIPNDGEVCGACVRTEIAAAEERGRRSGVEERDRLRALLRDVRGHIEWTPEDAAGRGPRAGLIARIDAALAPRDSGKEGQR